MIEGNRFAGPGHRPVRPESREIVRRAAAPAEDAAAAVRSLAADLGPGPFALVLVFAAPRTDRATLAAELGRAFPGVAVIGCTTAGEITGDGYTDGTIVAVAFTAAHFTAAIRLVAPLSAFDARAVTESVLAMRRETAAARPDWGTEFFFLLADGLSRREEALVAVLGRSAGTVPLFGGSAGDGLAFGHAFVLHDGAFREDAAVLALLRTDCPVRVFCLDHFVPTATKMVVTEAVPEQRLVRAINAEPAAREYARLVGKDPDQLSPFIFAAHPVVVRVGGQYHVRSIQKVEENGDLRFYSAIGEGLVLTVAEPADMAAHLDGALSKLAAARRPAAILGCDCILRRLEAEEGQKLGEVSAVLRRHGVTGFSTYGEQYNMLHVNQTLTGVAIYPPGGP